jgi:hypothetical protein
MFVRLKLRLDLAEVHGRPLWRSWPRRARRKQKLVQPPFIAILRQRPTEPGRGGSLQIPMNRRLTDRATTGNLLLPETQAEPET